MNKINVLYLVDFVQYFIRVSSGGGTRRAVALLNQSVIRREHSDGGAIRGLRIFTCRAAQYPYGG